MKGGVEPEGAGGETGLEYHVKSKRTMNSKSAIRQ